MSNLTIGRLGLDVDLDSIEDAQWSDSLELRFTISASTKAELAVVRDQLMGLLNNPDEPIVPITCEEDSSITGFWRVSDVSCDMGFDPWGNLAASASVTLERIASSSAPLVEGRTLFAQRDSAGPSPTHYTAIPDDAWGEQIDGAGGVARVANNGTVAVTTGNGLADSRPWWGVNPDDWYVGAARIEQTILDDGPALVGRQLPQNTDNPGLPFVQLSNGLLRIGPYPPAAHPTDAGIVAQRYDSSAASWQSLHFFRLFQNGSLPVTASLSAVTVLRNSPECAALRVTWSTGWTLDITLRRGSLMAELHMAVGTPSTPASLPMGVEHDGISSDASTSISSGWGLKASSTDADGDLWVMAAGQAVTLSTTNGRMNCSTSAGSASFGVGVCDGSTGNTPTDLVEQYSSAGSEQYRVVGR